MGSLNAHLSNVICERMCLAGRVALVTGGASGLGRSIVQCLALAGATVVATGSRTQEQAERDLAGCHGDISYRQCDIRDFARLKDFMESVGPVDILVNNAGNHCKKPIEEMTAHNFTEVIDVHLTAGFLLAKYAVPGMKKAGRGCILFQASMASFIGLPNVAGYSAAKAGVLGLVHSMASELGPFGIRVNAIAPGWIDTDMVRNAIAGDPERRNKILGRIPAGRLGDPSDIGMAALFLCSDAARYINGVCLPVDGGGLVGL